MRLFPIALLVLVLSIPSVGSASPAGPSGTIVVASGDGGSSSIHAVDVTRASERELSPTWAGRDIFNHDPVLSPDGKVVAFARSRGVGRLRLVTMATSGGPVRLVWSSPRADAIEPAWSPDGRLIAFVQGRVGKPEGPRSLWVVHRDGRGPRQLASLTGYCDAAALTGQCERRPSWSPDGSRIAYASRGDVFVVNLVSGRATNLTASNNVDDSNPAWSPDGRQIAWLRADNMHLMRADGSAKTRVTYIAARNKGRPVWSPNAGRPRLAFHVGLVLGQNSDIYVSTRGATRPRPITRTARLHETDPVWSPDGDWLAFTRTLPDTACCGELWVARPNGRDQRRLSEHADHASWSR